MGDRTLGLEPVAGEPLARALCPVRTAARHVTHVVHLCRELGRSPEEFPLFPSLAGDPVEKHAWVETIEAGVAGLGLAIADPDGRPKFGGHSLRVGGA